MEEHAVHSGKKHQIHLGFHLRQRCAEMLGEPGECLARSQWLACDMGSRCCQFEGGEIAGVGVEEPLILSQAFDVEFCAAVALYFRYIH